MQFFRRYLAQFLLIKVNYVNSFIQTLQLCATMPLADLDWLYFSLIMTQFSACIFSFPMYLNCVLFNRSFLIQVVRRRTRSGEQLELLRDD